MLPEPKPTLKLKSSSEFKIWLLGRWGRGRKDLGWRAALSRGHLIFIVWISQLPLSLRVLLRFERLGPRPSVRDLSRLRWPANAWWCAPGTMGGGGSKRRSCGEGMVKALSVNGNSGRSSRARRIVWWREGGATGKNGLTLSEGSVDSLPLTWSSQCWWMVLFYT